MGEDNRCQLLRLPEPGIMAAPDHFQKELRAKLFND